MNCVNGATRNTLPSLPTQSKNLFPSVKTCMCRPHGVELLQLSA